MPVEYLQENLSEEICFHRTQRIGFIFEDRRRQTKRQHAARRITFEVVPHVPVEYEQALAILLRQAALRKNHPIANGDGIDILPQDIPARAGIAALRRVLEKVEAFVPALPKSASHITSPGGLTYCRSIATGGWSNQRSMSGEGGIVEPLQGPICIGREPAAPTGSSQATGHRALLRRDLVPAFDIAR